MTKITKNVFLARSYLQQWCNKPYVDTPLNKYVKLMNTLSLKERRKVQNDIQVKILIKRVNK